MSAAALWSRLGAAGARAAFWCGLVVFFAVGFSEALGGWRWDEGFRTVAYGLGATGMVAGLAAGALRVPGWAALIGDASYSIYLVHLPAMSLVVKLAKPLGAPWAVPPMVTLVFLVLFAVAAGICVHLLIERQILAAAARLNRAPQPPVPQPAAVDP